jgi:hypothetical protein
VRLLGIQLAQRFDFGAQFRELSCFVVGSLRCVSAFANQGRDSTAQFAQAFEHVS